jgi:glycine cleavage system H protein
MSVILALLFLGIAIGVGAWLQRRRAAVPREGRLKAKPPPLLSDIFLHPGHAWVQLVQPDLVTVGLDDFTRSVFGSVEELALPEAGTVLQQGGKAWKLKRGARQLDQVSPISGRVVEVNRELVRDPRLLTQKDREKSWILKLRPLKVKRELENLLHGNLMRRWNQAVKEQLVATLTAAEFPVLQEGGEIKPDLGDELTPQQWKKVAGEFFKQP